MDGVMYRHHDSSVDGSITFQREIPILTSAVSLAWFAHGHTGAYASTFEPTTPSRTKSLGIPLAESSDAENFADVPMVPCFKLRASVDVACGTHKCSHLTTDAAGAIPTQLP